MLKKNKRMTTPKGRALWAKVNKPDTKFNPEGVYSVDFIIKQEEADQLVTAIAEAVQEQYQVVAEELKSKGKHADIKKIKYADNPYVEVYDEFGDTTGELKFKFKLKASGKAKDGSTFTQKPMLFDAEGNKIEVEIFNNSIIKVAFEIVPFYTTLIGVGVSLRLKAIQVIELVEKNGNSSAGNAFGFTKEEGYVAPKNNNSSINFEVFNEPEEADDSPF